MIELCHRQTKVELDKTKAIFKELDVIGNGLVFQCGIHEEDADKKAKDQYGTVSDDPLIEYAAKNVYGVGVPRRDFMTKMFVKRKAQFVKLSKAAMKDISEGTLTAESLDSTMKTLLTVWQRDAILTFGGVNHPWWAAIKKARRLNPNVLRATDLMLSSIKTKSFHGSDPSLDIKLTPEQKYKYSQFRGFDTHFSESLFWARGGVKMGVKWRYNPSPTSQFKFHGRFLKYKGD